MPNAPAWLRCEHCLWWKSAADPGDGWGCTYEGDSKPRSVFDRCYRWRCKRCLCSWDDPMSIEPINHLYCPLMGRAKQEKVKK